MAKILLIDDDKEVLLLNKKFLTGEGFQVLATTDPLKAISYLKSNAVDCVVLDIMMPTIDGLETCRRIRSFSGVPIIFLTGKASEDDKINGLLTGADDYIVKPFSLKELSARIQVILRRASMIKSVPVENLLVFDELTIDKLSHKVTFGGTDLQLSNREYEVLLYFATHPNMEVTFQELGEALFEHYEEKDRCSIMVNVSRLRKKMTIDPKLENMLETVWSKGYKFRP